MTNKKISDLTAAASIVAADLIPIVQSGATKKITFTNFAAAVTPASATTTSEGIAELATDAEAAAGTDTSRIVTPSRARYMAANEGFQKVVLSGAIGSASNGDMNISGSYKVNGTALSTIPQATPVSTGTASTLVLTVDFTTYSAYRLLFSRVEVCNNTSSTLTFAASSNGGGAYTDFDAHGCRVATATNNAITGLPGFDTGDMDMVISQPTTSGAIHYTAYGHAGTFDIFTIGGTSAISAAANRLKFTDDGVQVFTATGYYTLIPIAKR